MEHAGQVAESERTRLVCYLQVVKLRDMSVVMELHSVEKREQEHCKMELMRLDVRLDW